MKTNTKNNSHQTMLEQSRMKQSKGTSRIRHKTQKEETQNIQHRKLKRYSDLST